MECQKHLSWDLFFQYYVNDLREEIILKISEFASDTKVMVVIGDLKDCATLQRNVVL